MLTKIDIWKKITKNLKTKIPHAEFQTWFSKSILKELNSDAAIIEVPNKFFAHWVQDKYIIEIGKSFKKVLKKDVVVRFSYPHPISQDHKSRNFFEASMTFKSFVRGEFNRFAYSSALEIAKNPALQYNPLYIFSKYSLGKTHLLNAIGHFTLQKDPFIKIRYFSSDLFTSSMSYAIKNRTHHQFREPFDKMEMLLFDDVHKLEGRKRTQEEFLSLFDTLYNSKKQIVITGNKPPNQLMKMNSQLKSRLGWGLISEISEPDQKTKIDIIKRRSEEDNIHIPDDVVFFLAKSHNDFKALFQNIVRMETYTSLRKGEISISLIKSLMKENKVKGRIDIEEIKTLISGYFNIPVSDLESGKKHRNYSYPRQMAMYFSRKYTNLSYKEIGQYFGNRDHSSVIYAVRRIEKNQSLKKEVLEDIQRIEKIIT